MAEEGGLEPDAFARIGAEGRYKPRNRRTLASPDDGSARAREHVGSMGNRPLSRALTNPKGVLKRR